MNTPVYLSAREAAAELGVQPATLYAYVSRGLIRSVAGPGKQRRYDAADVRALQTRRDRAEDPRPSSLFPAQGADLQTRLTLITEDGPYYRGHKATDLAGSSSLEAVATLLWDCENDPFAVAAGADLPTTEQVSNPVLGPLDRLMVTLANWPAVDPTANVLAPRLVAEKGARLLRAGFSALLGVSLEGDLPLHQQMAAAWKIEDPAAIDVIRTALVLSADHELNTSAFAVRCAASTRAPLHACLLSGLGAFAGPRHGSAPERVMAWLKEIDEADTAAPLLAARLARGEDLPGFGHLIYRREDPRAECLLQALEHAAPGSMLVAALPAIRQAARDYFGLFPNIDFALSAVQRSLGLPSEAAKLMFCAGRIVGWIAHALEQYGEPQQIRPRANYIGPRPA